MKEEIFENGFLSDEFINPNYRGLSDSGGWPCSVKVLDGRLENHLVAVHAGVFITTTRSEGWPPRISHFTPKDIPVGELCWFARGDGEWDLMPFGKVVGKESWIMVFFYPVNYSAMSFRHCVPFLIAETAEKAEELKGWWK